MTSVIRKWGNSLGLRIPKGVAEQLSIGPGTTVEVTAEEGRLVIAPARPAYTLDQLVDGITPANVHGETDTGPARGIETW